MEAGVLGNYCLSEHLLGNFFYCLHQNLHFLFFCDIPIPHDVMHSRTLLKAGI